MGKTEIVHAALGDQDQVDGTLKDLWVVPKHLADPPLDAVTDNGTAYLLRDGDPDPRLSSRRATEIVDEPTPVTTISTTLESEKVPTSLEATLGS